MKTRKLIGTNIRAYRKELGISQETLAFKSKLNEKYVSQVERGEVNISVDSLEKIAKTLKVELYRLLVPNSIDVVITIK